MTAYYNEFDPFAAKWLRNLIDANLIAPGIVDDRSITDVTASDLAGFSQCHFFAGIGGWSLALRLAGVPDNFSCWTGSPPCQPFSAAGKQLGQLDERHLAPNFMRLVAQCRPPVLFGEQVAAAIGKHWLDDLFAELEAEGYACGAAVLPACSVGAYHKRDRLFFGANLAAVTVNQLADQHSEQFNRSRNEWTTGRDEFTDSGKIGQLGNLHSSGSQIGCSKSGELSVQERWEVTQRLSGLPGLAGYSSPHHDFWSNVDWLGCRDGKFRPVEPGTFPLAHGISARVGRLRGYGNAIVPQVAAEFIIAFMASAGEVIE